MSDGGRVYDVKTVRQVASRDVLFWRWVAPTRFVVVRNQIKSHSEHGREGETYRQRDRQTK